MKPRLTKRELEILSLICAGMANKQIAASLGITMHGVDYHIRRMFTKTGVHTRAELSGMVELRVLDPLRKRVVARP